MEALDVHRGFAGCSRTEPQPPGLRTRRAPTWACTAFERLSSIAAPFLQRYILLSPKLFEAVLLPAIADALEKNDLPSLTFLEELPKTRVGKVDFTALARLSTPTRT